MRFRGVLFLRGLDGLAELVGEARSVLGDDIAIGLLLRERCARLILGFTRETHPFVRLVLHTGQIRDRMGDAELPLLGVHQIDHAELSAHETRGLVRALLRGALFGLSALTLGAKLCVLGHLARSHGLAEVARRVVDLAFTVLEQGLQRVLR